MCNISFSLTDGHDVEGANGNQGFLLRELLKDDDAFLSKAPSKEEVTSRRLTKAVLYCCILSSLWRSQRSENTLARWLMKRISWKMDMHKELMLHVYSEKAAEKVTNTIQSRADPAGSNENLETTISPSKALRRKRVDRTPSNNNGILSTSASDYSFLANASSNVKNERLSPSTAENSSGSHGVTPSSNTHNDTISSADPMALVAFIDMSTTNRLLSMAKLARETEMQELFKCIKRPEPSGPMDLSSAAPVPKRARSNTVSMSMSSSSIGTPPSVPKTPESPSLQEDISGWSVEDVANFLTGIDICAEYAPVSSLSDIILMVLHIGGPLFIKKMENFLLF
ncbi:hypothetical protein HUJ04_007012 [Dendroctonus ponderosae]|nr:hypothetical protein HUJ04_007012 [Dendroctonus ponderosae]